MISLLPGLHVSIPAGFSDALRQCVMRITYITISVSIPAGFSDALRQYIYIICAPPVNVSIPAGFSDALRHVVAKVMGAEDVSFNPCWVF